MGSDWGTMPAKSEPLNSNECRARIQKMSDMILEGTREQVDLINEEAERLAADEKERIVTTETARMKRDSTRKGKQMSAKEKIEEQEILMQNALKAASGELANVHSSAQYTSLLEGLMMQALVKLNERRVTVQCLARDKQAVEQAGAAAAKKYAAKAAGHGVELIYSDTALPEMESADVPCLGGVVMWSEDQHICCKNTLNVRLEFVADTRMPKIKAMLFPENAAANKATTAQATGSVDDLLMKAYDVEQL